MRITPRLPSTIAAIFAIFVLGIVTKATGEALISSVSRDGGGTPVVHLTISGMLEAIPYDVQRATDLTLGDWNVIGTVQGNTSPMPFDDTTVGSATHSFYRLVAVPPPPTIISQAGWSLWTQSLPLGVDSQETNLENAPGISAFDGNPSTYWHTEWSTGAPPPPHEIQINLGGMYNVAGFNYLPRQDGFENGRIAQYEFYVSLDGVDWGSAVASGFFSNTPQQSEVRFAPKTGQYIRLRSLEEVNGNPWTCVAELNVLNSGDRPPDGTIDSPVTDLTINQGDMVTFSGSGTDPENDLPLFYHWNFGIGSGIADSELANPGAVQFNNTGIFTVTFTVTDSLGNLDPVRATRLIRVQSPNTVPHTGWSLIYWDSQETTVAPGVDNGAASNAFDGDIRTYWHTQWYLVTPPPPPHDIQIDLQSSHNLNGFVYLARQDGLANGRIGQYEFYVTDDLGDWGGPVAFGTLSDTAQPQPISFLPKTGRYIWLRAISQLDGNPYISVAELDVLEVPAGP